MFTGIIEGLGKITAVKHSETSGKLIISSTVNLDDLSIGDSMSVNGVCLTVTRLQTQQFEADVSFETFQKTILKNVKIGELVNLEKAARFSDRINGHFVSGHVDGIATIKNIKNIGTANLMIFSLSESLSCNLVTKGSIAIDGISLTINNCNSSSFEITVIPHTLEKTTLRTKKIGSQVNIELDILGKYVESYLKNISNLTKEKSKEPGVDLSLLLKNGFA